jgi:hypothetical protein
MPERSSDAMLAQISRKLNVLIALSLRHLPEDKEFPAKGKLRQGVGDLVHYLADMGIDPKDIADIVGSPVTSVRTFLTPTRRK